MHALTVPAMGETRKICAHPNAPSTAQMSSGQPETSVLQRRQAERVTLVLIVVLGVRKWFKTLVPEHPNESEQSSYA
jgi:hypothetical protein